MLELNGEAASRALAPDQVLPLVDRVERAELAALVAHEKTRQGARRIRVERFRIASRARGRGARLRAKGC